LRRVLERPDPESSGEGSDLKMGSMSIDPLVDLTGLHEDDLGNLGNDRLAHLLRVSLERGCCGWQDSPQWDSFIGDRF